MAQIIPLMLASKELLSNSCRRQCNLSTAYHHGSCAYLRRWGIIVGGTKLDQSPLRVATMSDSARDAADRLLGSKAHRVVDSMVPVHLAGVGGVN